MLRAARACQGHSGGRVFASVYNPTVLRVLRVRPRKANHDLRWPSCREGESTVSPQENALEVMVSRLPRGPRPQDRLCGTQAAPARESPFYAVFVFKFRNG